MKAVVIARPGGPEVLEIVERPDPVAGAGEILVRVKAFGLNRADLLQRRGLYPPPPGVPADIPGLEYAGEVVATGPGVSRLLIGTRVMGLVAGGAYAELAAARESEAVTIPAAMSDDDAAAVTEAFVTAFDALRRMALERGQWLLVHGAGSGVGTAAIQLAAAAGLRTVGTSRTAQKLERARALGLEVGVDPARQDFVDVARRVTGGRGVEGVLDLIGGVLLPRSLEALAPRGKLVLVGLTAGRRAELDLGLVLSRRLIIEGTVLRTRSPEEKADLVADFARDVLPLFAGGSVRPVVDRVFALDEVREAQAWLESDATFGKVVVRVDEASRAG